MVKKKLAIQIFESSDGVGHQVRGPRPYGFKAYCGVVGDPSTSLRLGESDCPDCLATAVSELGGDALIATKMEG